MAAGENLEIYGNKDLPEGSLERPVMTFMVLSFNQEKYIHGAVEGAFAQTYGPLEIILSDDCSTDRTFEMMREMAAAYNGKHRVLVRRNRKNLRPYSHVLEAARRAKGKIIVLAAGDDISKPNRTAKINRASRATDSWAFHSRFDSIDAFGNVLSTSLRPEAIVSGSSEYEKYFAQNDAPVYIVHGATSAYRKELIDSAPGNDDGILSEDIVFSILLNMKRRQATFIEESLVEYRTHSDSISNRPSDVRSADMKTIRNMLNQQEIYAKNIADRANLALRYSACMDGVFRPLNERYLRDEVLLQLAKCNWRSLKARERLGAFQIALRRHRIGYIVPSIVGPVLGSLCLWLRYRLLK